MLEWLLSKTKEITSIIKNVQKRNLYKLLMAMQTGAAILEINFETPQEKNTYIS